MFQDPNIAGGPRILNASDWQTQEDKIKRTLAMANALRQKGGQMPEGQMVSGHFVAPSWAEYLAPLLQSYDAGASEKWAEKEQKAVTESQRADESGWLQSQPKQQNVPFQAPGIDEADAAAASQGAQTVTKPTYQEHVAWAQRGLNNPLTRTMAQLQAAEIAKMPERQEQRDWRSEEAAASRAAAMEAARQRTADRIEELKVKLEDRGLDRASRETMAREQRALMAQLAGMADATRRELAANAAQLRRDIAGPKGAGDVKTTEGERASAGYLERMRAAEELLANPELKGEGASLLTQAVGGIPMVGKTVQPYVQSKGQQKVHQAQRDWVRAKLRKESGATIRDEEEAEEIRTYFPQPGDSDDVIAQKAAARQVAQRQLEIGANLALPQVSGDATGRAPVKPNTGGAGGSWKIRPAGG